VPAVTGQVSSGNLQGVVFGWVCEQKQIGWEEGSRWSPLHEGSRQRRCVCGSVLFQVISAWSKGNDLQSWLWNIAKEGRKPDHLVYVVSDWEIWRQQNY